MTRGSFIELEWNRIYSNHFASKREIEGGFLLSPLIITITQGAVVPRGTLETTMFRNVIRVARRS